MPPRIPQQMRRPTGSPSVTSRDRATRLRRRRVSGYGLLDNPGPAIPGSNRACGVCAGPWSRLAPLLQQAIAAANQLRRRDYSMRALGAACPISEDFADTGDSQLVSNVRQRGRGLRRMCSGAVAACGRRKSSRTPIPSGMSGMRMNLGCDGDRATWDGLDRYASLNHEVSGIDKFHPTSGRAFPILNVGNT